MPAQHRAQNGYRVFWDIGYSLDYEDADEALDFYCAMAEHPWHQEDIRRPRIFRVRNGELILRDEMPPD